MTTAVLIPTKGIEARTLEVGNIISSPHQISRRDRCVIVGIDRSRLTLLVFDAIYIEGNHKRVRVEFFVPPDMKFTRWTLRNVI